jgi:dihydrolipoamide dehydrogenase
VSASTSAASSKALLKNAEIAHTLKHKADFFGITGEFSLDFGTAWDRSRVVADGRVKGIHYLMKKNKVTEFEGRGTFTGPKAISVAKSDGSTEEVTFDNVIIATGSTVRLLPGVTLSENVVTYEEQILTRDLPNSIVIVGAGAIGMEFAYVMTNYGVKVTIIEFLDRALPNEDADVSKEIAKQYKNLGVDILVSTKVESVVDSGDKVTVTYTDNKSGAGLDRSRQGAHVDRLRSPVEGFGLENTGVKLTERGAIEIDDFMRTNVEGIYAIGDVTAKLQLAHVAEAQGVVAAETIGGAETMALGDYRMMPRATFCSPQVASFGYTEAQYKETGREYKVATFPSWPTARRTASASRSASSSSSRMPSTSSSSAATSSAPTCRSCCRSSPSPRSGT